MVVMAKQYVIRFTGKAESKKIELTDKEGEVSSFITTRELEIKILENLFMISMNNQKEMDKAFECRDCLDQVRNLKDESQIIFTAQDIKYLKDAFGETVNIRPAIWLDECYDLFKQINSPVEFSPGDEEEKIE